jgi:hypothetical protein
LKDNPYAHVFRSLGNIANLDEYQIELNTNIGVDQRNYNTPTISQVVAIWEEGSDTAKQFQMSIMVCGTSGDPQYIKAYQGCYDPLSYPLFFSPIEGLCVSSCFDFVYRFFFSQLVSKQYSRFQLMEMSVLAMTKLR